jgi:hypothetical protein
VGERPKLSKLIVREVEITVLREGDLVLTLLAESAASYFYVLVRICLHVDEEFHSMICTLLTSESTVS